METFTTTRFEGKIETFDPLLIDAQGRDMTSNVSQSQETIEIQMESPENNEELPMQEDQSSTIPVSTSSPNVEQNLTLTPVRLPAILDGEFYTVIRVDDTNVTVRCLQCQKLLNGNLKSTGNFLSHIKRVHPFLIQKIKSKSNQRKPAIAYIDLSAEKCPEIVRTKRGYRKCYKTDDSQGNNEEVSEQSSNNWSETDSPVVRRRRTEDPEPPPPPPSIEPTKFSQNNSSYIVEDEFDAIGRNVAAKLRNMRLDQRIVAEKLLNDVLFEGQLGTLHRDSNVHV